MRIKSIIIFVEIKKVTSITMFQITHLLLEKKIFYFGKQGRQRVFSTHSTHFPWTLLVGLPYLRLSPTPPLAYSVSHLLDVARSCDRASPPVRKNGRRLLHPITCAASMKINFTAERHRRHSKATSKIPLVRFPDSPGRVGLTKKPRGSPRSAGPCESWRAIGCQTT